MLTIWQCSQLWSPASIASLESVARHFTSQIDGLNHLDYWDHLKVLKLFSKERRRERYQIIFFWKIAQGLGGGCGGLTKRRLQLIFPTHLLSTSKFSQKSTSTICTLMVFIKKAKIYIYNEHAQTKSSVEVAVPKILNTNE